MSFDRVLCSSQLLGIQVQLRSTATSTFSRLYHKKTTFNRAPIVICKTYFSNLFCDGLEKKIVVNTYFSAKRMASSFSTQTKCILGQEFTSKFNSRICAVPTINFCFRKYCARALDQHRVLISAA